MPVSTYALTYDLSDLFGADLEPAHTIAWIETNLGPTEAVVDTSTGGQVMVGAQRVGDKTSLGTSVNLVPTDSTDTIPTNFQYRFWVTHRTVFGGERKPARWNSGWFSFTGAANLKDLVEEFYAPPTYVTQLTAELDAHADTIEAALDELATTLQDGLTAHAAGLEAGIDAAAGVATAAAALAESHEEAAADYAQEALESKNAAAEIAMGDAEAVVTAALDERVGAETVVDPAYPHAFKANGDGAEIVELAALGMTPKAAVVGGRDCAVHGWNGVALGETCVADGKISFAAGNTCICSANDSAALGNRTVAGRRYYRNPAGGYLTTGTEDAGDGLGSLRYAIIPDDPYGDVTSYFPNALTDNITTRYGAGAVMDARGNVYPPTVNGVFIPAVWGTDPGVAAQSIDEAPTTANDLQWAMHSWTLLRGGPSETAIGYRKIAKAVYTAGVGTKVYFIGTAPGSNGNVMGFYSSYSAVVLGGGNGMFSGGLFSSTTGYGAFASGHFVDAWGNGAAALGRESRAVNNFASVRGYQNRASGVGSEAGGQQAIASQDFETAFSAGMRVTRGDNQRRELHYNKTHLSSSGWGTVPLIKSVADGLYDFESTIMGYQTAGPGGTVGNSFVYKFHGAVTVKTTSGVTAMTPLGPIVRELIGRTGPVNEVQMVTVTGSPTGGDFTLSFGGNTTANIAYNATPAAVQSALEALASIGTGNVSVTSINAGGGPYRVEFTGTLGGADQATLTASGAGLSGGSSPGVSVAVVAHGSTTTMTGDGYTTGDRLTEQIDLYTTGGVKDIIVRLDQAGTTTYFTTTHTRVKQILA